MEAQVTALSRTRWQMAIHLLRTLQEEQLQGADGAPVATTFRHFFTETGGFQAVGVAQ